jgi:hypothetical protein
MDYEKFTSFCDRKLCLRKTFYNNKTCIRDSKRQSCFEKYHNKQDRDREKKLEVDEDEEAFKKEVWLRDFGSYPKEKRVPEWRKVCRYWLSLDREEQKVIESLHYHNLYLNDQFMDVAHILGKGAHIEHKYVTNNGVLMGRVFHSLIDKFINPLTNKHMDAEERNNIFERIKKC